MPPRSRSSFGGEANDSKDSIEEGQDGTGRSSLDDLFIKPTDESAAAKARDARRSRNSQNFAFAGESVRSSMNDVICAGYDITSDTTPHKKMEKVRERRSLSRAPSWRRRPSTRAKGCAEWSVPRQSARLLADRSLVLFTPLRPILNIQSRASAHLVADV